MKRILAEKKFCENYFIGKLMSLQNLMLPKIKLNQIFGKILAELTHDAKTSKNWYKKNGVIFCKRLGAVRKDSLSVGKRVVVTLY